MKRKHLKEFLAIRGMGQVISVTVAMLVMVLVFGVINPSFFSGENTTNLLRQVVPILIVGIGHPGSTVRPQKHGFLKVLQRSHAGLRGVFLKTRVVARL